MTPRSLPDDVLDRWLAGTPSTHDQAIVRAWLAEAPGREAELTALRIAAQDSYRWSRTDADRLASVKALARTAEFVRLGVVPVDGKSYGRSMSVDDGVGESHGSRRLGHLATPSTPSARVRWIWASVATLGAIAGVVLMTRRISAPSSTEATAQLYHTGTGQQRTLQLADGSRVTLAPRTTMTVHADYGASSRTISLDGEAYLDVQPGTRTPFLVRTGDVITRVLGTRFDVRRYATDAAMRVAVVSGKVQTERVAHTPVLLSAGMTGTISDSGVTVQRTGDVATYTEWTRGHLTFDVTPVPEVLATLERWYGVRFRLADPALRQGTVTGRLDFTTTEGAMKALKVLLGVTMTFEHAGDTTIVVLHAQGSETPMTSPHRAMPTELTSSREVGR